MIHQKIGNSYIQRIYKNEIDALSTQFIYYHNIDFIKNELVIHKREFKVLPKIKFIRGKETKIIISDTVIDRININIPFIIEKKTIMKDCTKFHNDYIEYEVEHKIYDQSISLFIKQQLYKYL